jgi:hypothetical protein
MIIDKFTFPKNLNPFPNPSGNKSAILFNNKQAKFALEQATKGQMGSRGITVLFL